jgi:UDP-N-acetylglucosamine 2-epimerase (non-hydrolysing)
MKVATLFGTRPEVIKFAPVIHELRRKGHQSVIINSGQHVDLLRPMLEFFRIEPRYHLESMAPGQGLNVLASRVLERLDAVLAQESPDVLLVQGDTTTALMGAIAGFNRKIPVGHIEAGLRSGNPLNPFPEEMNRRLISQLASFHFAATAGNARTLLLENVERTKIYLTGNPVIDSLMATLRHTQPGAAVQRILQGISGRPYLVLTTHRRENFGTTQQQYLQILRRFVDQFTDLFLVFPVHPNPEVRRAVEAELKGHGRILLVDPLGYADFLHLLKGSCFVVSDSGGVQEEVTALGKPTLILRSTTERPEAVESGVARLVGESPQRLAQMLQEAIRDTAWFAKARQVQPVFGDGRAASRIVEALEAAFPGQQFTSPFDFQPAA